MKAEREEGYQGWKNRETWTVHLWLTSDRDRYYSFLDKDADSIRSMIEDLTLSDISGLPRELIRVALNRVDWDEIAESMDEFFNSES